MSGDGSEGTRGRGKTNCNNNFVLQYGTINEMVLREKGKSTRELISKCKINKRQWNKIPFEKETFLK